MSFHCYVVHYAKARYKKNLTWYSISIFILFSFFHTFIFVYYSFFTYKQFRGTTFYFVIHIMYRYFTYKNITWSDAELVCNGFTVPCSDGSPDVTLGHLTSVHSREEMTFLIALYESVRDKQRVRTD